SRKRESSAPMSLASNSSWSRSAFALRTRRSRSLRPPRGPAAIMSERALTRPLLALLHICDSLFPIGGFGYSDGLEAATAARLVETSADPGAGLGGCVDEVAGRRDGPAVVRAWCACDGQR